MIVDFISLFIFIMKTDYIYIKPFLSIESENNIWYKNLKFLGKGGNGTAFLVLCTSGENMGGIFTLKILHKISDDNRIAKFKREINYMQEHPTHQLCANMTRVFGKDILLL